ncbi:DNA topoisomerase IV [Psychroflexus sp. ALD_RP9]|uniref:DNA topoisomerase IV n=1 Tax=Psychroflexus sp. ALD_RP9 TaxID=2777186 RepID=UPI001A8DE44A|nr:DNA topoisomerase IV [Psychroflexus sp. ALD_RP9]QSS97020.1 DNA topoisomerase IV [Psychroflexus sp. ALD_RP9]
MNKVVYLVLLSVVLSSCYQSERNCNKFKTGVFEFKTLVNGELETTKFIRNDSIEIELYKNKRDTAYIRWVNDCQYILTSKNPKNRSEKKPIQMRILTTNGDTYKFSYNIVGETNTQQGQVTKISELK